MNKGSVKQMISGLICQGGYVVVDGIELRLMLICQ